MSKALSVDLRNRVVAAIDDVRPGPVGGDRRSQRVEAHAEVILALLDKKRDATLEELRAGLAELGVGVSMGTLWRFLDRRKITLKNLWPTPPARSMVR